MKEEKRGNDGKVGVNEIFVHNNIALVGIARMKRVGYLGKEELAAKKGSKKTTFRRKCVSYIYFKR